jgi:hypothetical protein
MLWKDFALPLPQDVPRHLFGTASCGAFCGKRGRTHGGLPLHTVVLESYSVRCCKDTLLQYDQHLSRDFGGLGSVSILVRVLIAPGGGGRRNSYINEFKSISVVAHRIHLCIQMSQISPSPPRQSRKAPSIERIDIPPLRQMVIALPPPLVRAPYPVVPMLQIYRGLKVGELRPSFSTREPEFSLWLL